VLRGGSFNNQASNVRSANRNNNVPTNRYILNGFRPARTFIP
jgi:formylglycine-generating enzyme required for sulfatase activity